MSKLSRNNLLFLADFYNLKADSLLNSFAQALKKNKIPDEAIPSDLKPEANLFSFIGEFLSNKFKAKEKDIAKWLILNQTILREFNFKKFYQDDKDDKALSDIRVVGKTPDGDNIVAKYILRTEPIPADYRLKDCQLVAKLMPSKPIKETFLYRYEVGSKTTESSPKELKHYSFLIGVISTLANEKNHNNSDLVDATYKFIEENKELLDKIMLSFKTLPRYINEGADGIVFSIGENRVIKFLNSKFAYDKSIEAVNRIFEKSEGAELEPMIYDHGQFKPITIKKHLSQNLETITIYYYIMEKMVPVFNIMNENVIVELLDKIFKKIENIQPNILEWKQKLKDKNNKIFEEIDPKTKEITTLVANEIINDPVFYAKLRHELRKSRDKIKESLNPAADKKFEFNSNWLQKLVKEIIWNNILDRKDLFARNLGITGYGDFRYFDPANEKYK